MSLALWILAGLLAAGALTAGSIKLLVPKHRLAETTGGGWTREASVGFVKMLGVLELLAAVGLILPAAVDMVPVMVPVTAACWALLMTGAMITHGRRREPRLAIVNLVYLAVAVFIAWGRFGPYSFQ